MEPLRWLLIVSIITVGHSRSLENANKVTDSGLLVGVPACSYVVTPVTKCVENRRQDCQVVRKKKCVRKKCQNQCQQCRQKCQSPEGKNPLRTKCRMIKVCEDDEYADCTTRRVCYDRPLQRCLQEQCNGCTRDTAEDCPKACTIVDELQCTETERLCTDEQEARLVCPEVIAWPVKQK